MGECLRGPERDEARRTTFAPQASGNRRVSIRWAVPARSSPLIAPFFVIYINLCASVAQSNVSSRSLSRVSWFSSLNPPDAALHFTNGFNYPPGLVFNFDTGTIAS